VRNNKENSFSLKENFARASAKERKKISIFLIKSMRKEYIDELNKKLKQLKGKFFSIDFDSEISTYAMFDPTLTEKYCDIVHEKEIAFFLESLMYDYIELKEKLK